MQWLRRSFITGFFVTVPLFITVAAFVWIFGVVDGLTTPFYSRLLGRPVPGLGIASTAVAVASVGFQHVSAAADRMDEFLRPAAVDLVAEIIDVDINDVGEGVEILIPDMF